jgi:glucan endo-1,3-alpha-glucosidase
MSSDYGESHYIGPAEPHHTDDGSSEWANGFPHDGWRLIMKPYIAAYKAGASAPTVTEDQLVYWYRPTPWDVTCTNDTLGPPNGRNLLADVVFATTLLTSPATLTITSGNNAPVSFNAPAGIVTFNATMGLGSQTFTVTRGGTTIMGGTSPKVISGTCETYNYNAYVGSFNSTGSGTGPTSSSSTVTSPKTTTTSTTSTSTSHTTSTSTSPTTSTSTSHTTTTSTSHTTTTTTSSSPTSTPVCIAGTGPGNYLGLCNFACNYGYCPAGVCTCTAMGTAIPPPPSTGHNGAPLPGENNSYLGLCSFCCSHGYCPSTACVQT